MILTSISEAQNRFYDGIDECAGLEPYDYSHCLTVDEACMEALQETQYEYDAFERALYEAEVEYVQEHGAAMVYTEASVGEMVEKAVDAVKEWLKRIMGVLDRFMHEVASKIQLMRTKIFRGNKQKIEAGRWQSSWDFKGIDYYAESVKKFMASPLIGSGEKGLGFKDIKTRAMVGLAGHVLDGKSKGTDFSIRDWKEDNLKETTIGEAYVNELKPLDMIRNGYADGLKEVKKQKDAAKKAANELIKNIKEVRSNDKDSADDKAKDTYKFAINAIGKINAHNTSIITLKLTILMGRLNQAYKCAGILTRSNGKIGKKINDAGGKFEGMKQKLKDEANSL